MHSGEVSYRFDRSMLAVDDDCKLCIKKVFIIFFSSILSCYHHVTNVLAKLSQPRYCYQSVEAALPLCHRPKKMSHGRGAALHRRRTLFGPIWYTRRTHMVPHNA